MAEAVKPLFLGIFMDILKSSTHLLWDETLKIGLALVLARILPPLLDRVQAALVVVGGRLSDWIAEQGYWMRERLA
jgi:hypothetical protein